MQKIYILHGWTYSLDNWERFSKMLKNNGFEPVFLKIPGLTAVSDEVWDIEKYSKWLMNELETNTKKITLLGHSNGGRIAAYFAYKHPEKLEKLILMDSAGIYHKELSKQIKRILFGSAAKVGKLFTRSAILKKLLYRLARERDYQNATPEMRKSMVNLIKTDIAPLLPKIKTPTLIIWGDSDKITPASDAKLMHKLIPNSKLKMVNGARHSPFYTHPLEVFNIINNDF